MRFGKSVKPFADLADVMTVRVEFEQFASRLTEDRAGNRRIRTGEYEDVAFGIDRHTRHFAKVPAFRQIREVRN